MRSAATWSSAITKEWTAREGTSARFARLRVLSRLDAHSPRASAIEAVSTWMMTSAEIGMTFRGLKSFAVAARRCFQIRERPVYKEQMCREIRLGWGRGGGADGTNVHIAPSPSWPFDLEVWSFGTVPLLLTIRMCRTVARPPFRHL